MEIKNTITLRKIIELNLADKFTFVVPCGAIVFEVSPMEIQNHFAKLRVNEDVRFECTTHTKLLGEQVLILIGGRTITL